MGGGDIARREKKIGVIKLAMEVEEVGGVFSIGNEKGLKVKPLPIKHSLIHLQS